MDHEPKDSHSPAWYAYLPRQSRATQLTDLVVLATDAAQEVHTYSAHAVTRELTSARDITRAMRSLGHFEKPKPRPRDRLDDEYDLGSPSNFPPDGFSEQTENELDVKVQVEHSVKVDYDPHAYDRETYLKQKTSHGG